MRAASMPMVCLLFTAVVGADDDPLWLRYPAISPDGRTIAFTYKGDIYSVPAVGGAATPLTISESYEFSPVWSHDGRSLAFASDRYGNFDVYVMPSIGGEARRLTFHSNGEIPSTFTVDDQAVLFSGHRQDLITNGQFPISMMDELYRVPVGGGRVAQVLPVPARDATLEFHGRPADLPRHQGLREQLAQAPYFGGDARRLDLRLQDQEVPAGHPVPRRGPQPGLRRRRRRVLLPERAERLVQRPQKLACRIPRRACR